MNPYGIERESIVPLLIGLVLGILVTVVLLPASARGWYTGSTLGTALEQRVLPEPAPRLEGEPEPPLPLPKAQQIELGDDEPSEAKVAWISYEYYQELVAPDGTTVQPALQQAAQPTPDSPQRIEATAPQSMAPPEPERPDPIEVPESQLAEQPKPQPENAPSSPPATGQWQPSLPELGPVEDPQFAVTPPAQEHVPTPEPDKTEGLVKEEPQESPTLPVTKKVVAKPTKPVTHPPVPSKPTASPRSDREALPVVIRSKTDHVVVGRVIAMQGLRIQTFAPRISTVTYLTAMRGGVNMPVRVVFNKKGKVTKAELKGRSGYPEVDTPIRSSLYQWKASGKRLAKMNGPFEISIHIRIGVR